MLALGTLATFAFYQWTQVCVSRLTFFLSASVLVFVILVLAFPSFFIWRISKKPDGLQRLFSADHTYVHRWGSMYDKLAAGQVYFSVAVWTVVLLRSAITGFGQRSGVAQVVSLIIVDLVFSFSKRFVGEFSCCGLTMMFSRYIPISTFL
jgi:Transient receptor potential (TRP) ion channel